MRDSKKSGADPHKPPFAARQSVAQGQDMTQGQDMEQGQDAVREQDATRPDRATRQDHAATAKRTFALAARLDRALRRTWPLVAACYLLALVGVLGVNLLRLAIDSHDRATGRLQTQELRLEDFQLVNAYIEAPGVLRSENEDPQMCYGPTAAGRLDSLTIWVSYTDAPYERCLYYVTRPDEAFGQEKRVWARENADGSLTFQLPRGVLAIRLDPGSRSGLGMRFERILLNAPKTAAQQLLPTAGGWFYLLVLPALAAAALQWLWQALCPPDTTPAADGWDTDGPGKQGRPGETKGRGGKRRRKNGGPADESGL